MFTFSSLGWHEQTHETHNYRRLFANGRLGATASVIEWQKTSKTPFPNFNLYSSSSHLFIIFFILIR